MPKIKITNPFSSAITYLTQSTGRIFIVTAIGILLLPLAFLTPTLLNSNAWNDVTKDNLEKHKLLATSLVEPVKLNVALHQNSLQLLENELKESITAEDLLNKYANSRADVVAVSLLLSGNKSPIMGVTQSLVDASEKKFSVPDYISKEFRYQKYDKRNSISPVFKSSFSNQPVILIKHHILDKGLNKRGTLFAEVGLNFLQRVCSQMNFGNQGHCTIVDNKSRILAHPNKAWVSKSHNIASHPLVQKLKTHGSGSLQYLSTNTQSEMIGGFAQVKELNWGIIISRPKTEIDVPFANIKASVFIWLGVGIALSLLIAFVAGIKLTKSLKTLSESSEVLAIKRKSYKLEQAPKGSPADVKKVWNTISKLLIDYQDLNAENNILKTSTNKNQHKIVANLREQNIKKPNNTDELTGITNGTCFLEELQKTLLTQKGEIVAIILVEVDNYQPLLTSKGKARADAVIKHVGQIVGSNTRSLDMAARYGTMGRFAIHVNNCSAKSLQGTAKKLRSTVETSPILLGGETVYITLSMGIVGRKIDDKITVNSLMSYADQALQKSKSVGEKKISSYQIKQPQSA